MAIHEFDTARCVHMSDAKHFVLPSSLSCFHQEAILSHECPRFLGTLSMFCACFSSLNTACNLPKGFTVQYGEVFCRHKQPRLLCFKHMSLAPVCRPGQSFFGAFLCGHNRLMHTLNGNTGGCTRFAFLNSDGIMGKDRASSIGEIDADVIALSETHLSDNLMKLAHGRFPGYSSFWGSPVKGKSGGVGFLIKPSSFWHISPVKWDSQSPCYKYFLEGRLYAVSVFLGKGSSQLIVYTAYGYAGSRWSSELKQKTHNLIEAICVDIAARGLPSIFGGDLNIQTDESNLLEALPQLGFTNLASLTGQSNIATCFKGKEGSTIDHVFCNGLMLATFSSLQIKSQVADHAPLVCTFTDTCLSQLIHSNRFYGDFLDGDLSSFVPSDTIVLSSQFVTSLRTLDLDKAYRIWSCFAERHLHSIHEHLESSSVFKHGRGSIRLDPQHVWPHTRGEAAASLPIRKMWRQCCRMVQVKRQPHGQVALRTWTNAQKALQFLTREEFSVASSLLAQTPSEENATALLNCFNAALERMQKFESKRRISNWKRRLQSSVKAQHSWMRQDTANQQQLCFQDKDGVLTASIPEQFDSVTKAWSAVTELFKDKEPDHELSFQKYDQYISSFSFHAQNLTCDSFCAAILETPESSPGLDNWTFHELKLLAKHCPFIFESFVQLLQTCETSGRWPQPLVSGFCSLIPKSEEAPNTSLDLRPITVLSSLYRIWARMRAQELTRHWQEGWIADGAHGGRQAHGAETVIFEVMSDLEGASANQHVAGLSFDLIKAFDRIPRGLLAKILEKMNMPNAIRIPYVGMLYQATRRYKIRTALDRETPIYGGILQGCPLSMLAMNAITNIWVKALKHAVPACVPRSYVDDVSATVQADSKPELIRGIQTVFATSEQFVLDMGGTLNTKKSFSFGNTCVANTCHPELEHKRDFRLVGGSITYRNNTQSTVTALELHKLAKWTRSIRRSRHLPVTWAERCAALMRTRSQFTWGTGSHTLCHSKNHLDLVTQTRSAIMRCLLRRDRYIANPSMYFCIIAPPTLNPLFARVVDGLLNVRRVILRSAVGRQIRNRYESLHGPETDGPASFLRQTNSLPGFIGSVDAMFRYGFEQPDKWLPDVRQIWRQEQFRRLAVNRPDFDGVQLGVNKEATVSLLKTWEAQAVSTHDHLAKEDLLQNAAVLRLLLTGGLMTPSIDSKHRKKGATFCSCSIGGEHTVMHVSWYCAFYQNLRQPIMELFHLIIQASPCFRFATIITNQDEVLKPHIVKIQTILVAIWRAQIKDYVGGETFAPPPAPQPTPQTQGAQEQPISDTVNTAVLENGHHIVSIPAGGLVCRKCGKHTAWPKHRRLKISNTPCTQAHLSEPFWTSTPGVTNNPHYNLDNFVAVCKIESQHDLAWNLETSHQKGGKIKCLTCSTEFAWNNRHNITKQRKCTGAHARKPTPPKWISYRMYREDFRTAFIRTRDVFDPQQAAATSCEQNPSGSQMPIRTRLRTKTRVNSVQLTQPSSSSSSFVSRAPIFAPTVSSEGLQSTFFVHFDDMG